jgi:hypothetical protein
MRFVILFVATILSASILAPAQTTQPAPGQPAPAQSAEQKMNGLLTPPPNYGTPLPSTPATPAASMDKTTGPAAAAPVAPNVPVVREGTHRVNISGRLSHSPDGQQAIFTFDSDGTTMKDPPMIILPNMKLEGMEAAVLNKNGDVHFRVSGTVTEYKGRNFILLDKAVVMADVEKQF